MSAREVIDWTLQHSGWGTLDEIERNRWIDCQPDFDNAHYIDGFAWPDGQIPLQAGLAECARSGGGARRGRCMPCPGCRTIGRSSRTPMQTHPFRLVTAPARNFLNSSFTEMPTSRAKKSRPEVLIHPADAAAAGHRRWR